MSRLKVVHGRVVLNDEMVDVKFNGDFVRDNFFCILQLWGYGQ